MPVNIWGGRGTIRRDKTGEIYCFPRKTYTRNHPYPILHMIGDKCFSIKHFKSLPRERTTIIKLRNYGHSIHNIAEGLGRSTSFVYETLFNAKVLGLLRSRLDNRKIPRRSRLYMAPRKRLRCLAYIQKWLPFILGQDGEPP